VYNKEKIEGIKMNQYEVKNFTPASFNVLYQSKQETWKKNETVYNGEDAVKGERATYLLPTKSMENDATGKKYALYVDHAVMPDFFMETVEGSIGVLCAKPPTVELPTALEPMSEIAVDDGSSLKDVVNGIYRGQLKNGRVGAALVVDESIGYPVIKLFDSLCVLDWIEEKKKLKAVLTCEAVYTVSNSKQTLSWVYTVFAIDSAGKYYTIPVESYKDFQEFNFGSPGDGAIYPTIAGNPFKGDEVPFVIFNTTDLGGNIEKARLQNIVNESLHYYKDSADYEQQLHMSAQDTFTVTGVPKGEAKEIALGAGNFVWSTKSEAKFGYIGISGAGIGAQKDNLDSITENIAKRSLTFMADSSNSQSGVSLEIKRTSATANLVTIADTLTAGMNKLLGFSCRWLGLNQDELKFDANRDFSRGKATVAELIQLWGAKLSGLIITNEDIFKVMQQSGLTEAANYDEQAKLLDGEALPASSIPEPHGE